MLFLVISTAQLTHYTTDGSAEHATQAVIDVYQKRLNEGENFHEGIKAFVEKRSPQWVGSKL